MRIAAIYDIHGNLPALEAVLEEIRAAKVDHLIVGGDIVPGPMPRETLDRLLRFDVPAQFIQGNCEVAMLAEIAERDSSRMPEQARETVRWAAQQFSEDYMGRVRDWPKTVSLHADGLGEVLFCHATPRDENEIFTRQTPDEHVAPAFQGVTASVVVCGHTHMQFDRRVGQVRVVNAGSVGMPFGEPGAYWLLLGSDVQLRRTAYDLTTAAERIRATRYPQADDFVSHFLLEPPTEAQMLDVFAKAAMGPVTR